MTGTRKIANVPNEPSGLGEMISRQNGESIAGFLSVTERGRQRCTEERLLDSIHNPELKKIRVLPGLVGLENITVFYPPSP